MTPKTRSIITLVAVGAGTAAAAAAVTFAIMNARSAELETRAREAETTATSLRAQLDDVLARQSGDPTPTSSSAAPDDAPDAEDGSMGTSQDVSRQYTYITAADASDGVISLTLDYAQFLTGAAAAKAAADAGDESPPPNDYYMTNTNPRLRTFEVATDAEFIVAGDTPEDTRRMSAQEFFDAFVADAQGVRDTGYWVTVSDGEISRAEEQWLP